MVVARHQIHLFVDGTSYGEASNPFLTKKHRFHSLSVINRHLSERQYIGSFGYVCKR